MLMSPTSIIIDIETLSCEPTAIITEIGLLAFDRYSLEPMLHTSIPEAFSVVDEFTIHPDLFAQMAAGRTSCPETLAFHRSNETLPTFRELQSPPKVCCHLLRDFIERMRPHRIWIQGPDFDRPILENFCTQFGDSLPWEFWRTRDSRTLWDLAFPGERHASRPHHALPDCRATLADLTKSLQTLNRIEAA